jgi:hypothetical protein
VTVPRDYPLFIEVAICAQGDHIATFSWKYTGAINEKMKCADD